MSFDLRKSISISILMVFLISFAIVNISERSRSIQTFDEEGLHWTKRGYDDLGSFHYSRPSVSFQPGNTKFKTDWEFEMDHEGSSTKWQWAFTGNLDNDSCLETVALGVDRFFAVDDDGKLLFNKPTPKRSILNLVEDANDDGFSELFIGIKGIEGEQPRIEVRDRFGDFLKKFVLTHFKGRPVNDGTTEVWTVQDIDADGEKEIVFAFHASYDRRPRGIICLGYDSWSVEWTYAFAAHVSNMIFPDLDGDGIKEIVFGTSASFNGAVYVQSGSNDWNSYIVALKKGVDGYSSYWRYQIPHEMFDPQYFHTMISCADTNGDGELEIIGYLGNKLIDQSAEHGYLILLKGRTRNINGELIRQVRTEFPWVRPGGVADLDDDGNLETVVIGDTLGLDNDYVAIYDLSDLSLEEKFPIRETEDEYHTVKPVGLNDINGDGKIEIITCNILTGEIKVFDPKLNELWSHITERSNSTALLSDIVTDGVNEILMIGNKITLLSLEVDLDLKKVSPVDDDHYLFPGDTIEFEVEIENVGDLIWDIEISMIEEFDNKIRFIDGIDIVCPDPGKSDKIGFFFSPTNVTDEVDISIVINISQVREGIHHFLQKITWKVWVIADEMMDRLFEIEWCCPEKANPQDLFNVNGSISNTIMVNNTLEGPLKNKLIERISFITIYIKIESYRESSELSPTGGKFSFEIRAPPEPGEYTLTVGVTTDNERASIEEYKTLKVESDGERRGTSSIWLAFLILAVSGIGSYGIIRRIRKIRLKNTSVESIVIPPIAPFSRKDIPIESCDVKNEILKTIKENPGVTHSEISAILGDVDPQLVSYHLRWLSETNNIHYNENEKATGRKLYSIHRDFIPKRYFISSKSMEIVEILHGNPDLRMGEIRKKSRKNKDWGNLHGRLSRLLDRKIIERDENKRYRLISGINIDEFEVTDDT